MPYTAVHRFARISPQKVRPFADLIRGKTADEAINILRYHPNRAARMLEKVVKSALANAEDQRERDLSHLEVVEVCVDCGPMFRRMRPKGRGMSQILKKRMSHIRVELD